jgi:hypothetical protein
MAEAASASVWPQVLRRPALLVWCIFLFVNPLYIMPSGLPQPGDALVFVLLPLALATWDGRLDGQSVRLLRALVWFTLWVCLVDYGWAFIEWKWNRLTDFIIHPLYLIFNLSLFFSALVIARGDPKLFLKATVEVVFVTIIIQFVASFFYRTELYRGQLFFNSPNQLGYYALLASCLIALTQRKLGMSRLRAGIGVTCCVYLAVLSASRASAVGITLLLFLLLFSSPRTIVIASIAAIGLLTVGGPISKAIDKAKERTESAQSRKESFADERGYDRIWKHPEYLLAGAGEGDYRRFAKPGELPRELHSSFGSILFCYGVIGLFLFGLFFGRILNGATPRSITLLVPGLLYAVAHQGLRFTMFWVVLAGFFVLKQLHHRDKAWAAPNR